MCNLLSCSDITLTCGSGTKKVNDECVPDNEFFDILQKKEVQDIGRRSNTKQDCEYFGGEYIAGSVKKDPLTNQDLIGSGRCQIPGLEWEDKIIIQEGLCGRKVKSDVEFCKNPILKITKIGENPVVY